MKPQFLAVAGTMGVGKTTVAKLLASHLPNTVLLEENFVENPFLSRFYQDMKRWAYHSQTFFLLEKIKQTFEAEAILKNGKTVIVDTPIYEDVFSYAKAQFLMGNMDEAEFELYTKMYSLCLEHLRQPDLILFLEADLATITSRITGRQRSFEKQIPQDYLTLLDRLNHEWLKKVKTKIPVLTIDAQKMNLASNQKDIEQFVELINTQSTVSSY